MATTISLSHRDRAILKAVASGRCQISRGVCASLTVDGLSCCDQFIGARLAGAGLIAAPGWQPEPARLTESGRAILQAA